jgi:cellulose synthase/poly-beta-1,6-N-acetylglucosamine synthase-like glycosyltransferase
MIAMRIAEKGYVIAYEPNAFALEGSSANSKEELKRKIRIAAGGIQSILRLKKAANPFHNFTLTFQYISHRVLRWAITPWVMVLAFLLNIFVCFNAPENIFFTLILLAQCAFYFASFLGYVLESKKIKIKVFFIPYYFSLMNYAAMAGAIRYFKGKQSAAWEKSKRR